MFRIKPFYEQEFRECKFDLCVCVLVKKFVHINTYPVVDKGFLCVDFCVQMRCCGSAVPLHDFLGRRLAARTLPPVTIRELRLALQDEWAAMPQQLIDTLILSMGRRCETCLAVRGRSYPLLKT
ncbi:hypothetical protein TNCV_1697361 [Trichonephila clavipes]|nr:hypothetical protein TNCV_1697361 [Trichonephila clavipes]